MQPIYIYTCVCVCVRAHMYGITNTNNADHRVFHANTPAHAESELQCLESAARQIGFYVTSNNTDYTCFKQDETPNEIINF